MGPERATSFDASAYDWRGLFMFYQDGEVYMG
jgi:hypothetical protein